MEFSKLNNFDVNVKKLDKELSEIILELKKYINSSFQNLKNDVMNNHIITSKNKFIEMFVVNKYDVYKYNNYYFPIKIKEDNSYIKLDEVYVDLDIFELELLVNRSYKCWIEYEGEYIDFDIKLRHNSEYLRKIIKLKEIFELNCIEWNTVNLATIVRMCDVVLENEINGIERSKLYDIVKKIKNGEIVLNIDFDGYDNSIKSNSTILWNIEEKEVISSMFVKPVKHDMSYEHRIICDENEIILIDNTDDQDILFTYEINDNEISIISKRKDNEIWNIYSLKDVFHSRTIFDIVGHGEYISNNVKIESYIDKIRDTYKIKNMSLSKAGIEKIFNDYKFIKDDFIISSITYEFDTNNNIIDEKGEQLYFYDIDNLMNIDNKKDVCLSRLIEKNIEIETNRIGTINLFLTVNNNYKYLVDNLSFIISKIKECMPFYSVKVYKYD